MINIEEHIIFYKESILEALRRINYLPATLTLFVLDERNQLIGTLTDGDIRRGLLQGKTLDLKASDFMNLNFQYLTNIDVEKIKKLKQQKIKLLPILNDVKQILRIYDLQRLNAVLPIEVVIMAGGEGKRLRPLTDRIPKPMLKLGDKPIIEHLIDRMVTYGIEKIYISVNYLKDQIINYFKDGSSKGIEIEYLHEDKPLGTAGALKKIKKLDKDILLLNSDLFTNIDLNDFYMSFLNNNADLAIASIPYTVNIPYAILEEKEGKIVSFKEKPSNTNYANAGIYLLKRKLIDSIPENQFYNATDLMQHAINSKKKIIHNPLIGYWIDIGKMDDFEKAKEIIKHVST